MFSGIINGIGVVESIKKETNLYQIAFHAPVLHSLELGESIAVNGICLTVATIKKHTFTVDIMPETIQATSLKNIELHTRVNVEHSLKWNQSIGGHFITGHIDNTATIQGITQEENARIIWLLLPQDKALFCIKKGSIAVDGVSLTIFDIKDNCIKLSLIPHTCSHTILGEKKIGDSVNIEIDILSKLVYQFLSSNNISRSPEMITWIQKKIYQSI